MFGAKRITFISLISCLSFLQLSCSGSSSGSGSDDPCHGLSMNTCMLPFPSDEWSVRDSASATGLVLKMPDSVIDQSLFEKLPERITLASIFNGSSGFSAAGSVLFEFPDKLDASSLPEDGGEAVIALNLLTGERIAVNSVASVYAASDLVAEPANIVEIYPRSRWQFGERYVVIVTNELMPKTGSEFSTAQEMNSRAVAYAEQRGLLQTIADAGIAAQSILTLTDFTIRTEEEVTAPLRRMTSKVLEYEHPIANVRVFYKNPLKGHTLAKVTGDVLAHSFRGSDGGINFDQDEGTRRWIPFELYLPARANKGPVPIAIYGHGLTASKETVLIVSESNAANGIATIAIDHPNHGDRSIMDGGNVVDIVQPQNLQKQLGMVFQSSVDFMSVLKAVQTSIGQLDVLPRAPNSLGIQRVYGSLGDGIADIDTSMIFYEGTSLGGVLGSAFVALAPDIKGAFLQVTGVGIIHILSDSFFWNELFHRLIPKQANGAEAAVLRAALQQQMDYGDAINFVHYFRNPPEGIAAKPVGVVVVAGDGVVTNPSSIAFAEIAGLPLVGGQLFPMPGVMRMQDYDNGYGMRHLPSKSDAPRIGPLIAHVSFNTWYGQHYMDKWIERFILLQQ